MFLYLKINPIYQHLPFPTNKKPYLKMFTANDQLTLQSLFKQLKQLYQELKACQHPPIQSTIIWSIKPKCDKALQILSKCHEKSDYIMKRKQIMEIKYKVQEIQKKLIQEEFINPQIGHGGRKFNNKCEVYNQAYQGTLSQFKRGIQSEQSQKNPFMYNRQSNNLDLLNNEKYLHPQIKKHQDRSQISRASLQILRSIAMQEVKSVDLKYNKQQIQQILTRLESNKQLMAHIQGMVVTQGNNLNKIQQHIQKAYNNVQSMNGELDQAETEQIKAVNKVRKAFHKTASCFWGFFTWPFRKMGRKKFQASTSTPTS